MRTNLFLSTLGVFIGLLLLVYPSGAMAGGHKISVGAPTMTGGSNPISFSGPEEFSYTYINSARDREIIVGLIPGLGYAVRFEPSKGFPISLGGALTLGLETFVGIYFGAGWEFWCPGKSFCMSVDYRSTIAPYSQKRSIHSSGSVSLGGIIW